MPITSGNTGRNCNLDKWKSFTPITSPVRKEDVSPSQDPSPYRSSEREREDRERVITWGDALTLEAWVEKMIREGKGNEVLPLLRVLPEEKKEYYRKVWSEHMKEKDKI